MALSHHVLVAWAAAEVYPGNLFLDYSILGDDIAIWDEAVARVYLSRLQLLGVEVSSHKSFAEVGLAEFAKSYYHYGKDLKPISPDLLLFRRDTVGPNLIAIGEILDPKGL